MKLLTNLGYICQIYCTVKLSLDSNNINIQNLVNKVYRDRTVEHLVHIPSNYLFFRKKITQIGQQNWVSFLVLPEKSILNIQITQMGQQSWVSFLVLSEKSILNIQITQIGQQSWVSSLVLSKKSIFNIQITQTGQQSWVSSLRNLFSI